MIKDEDRCEAEHPVRNERGEITWMLRCTRHRLHVEAPIGFQENPPWGRSFYLLPESRPHHFAFEVES